MARIRVWTIIGDASTGKSTSIGHLISQLGRGGGGFRWVPLRGGGYLQVYARRQSLQEAKRTPNDVMRETQKLVRAQEKKTGGPIDCLNLLMAIRSDSINKLPVAAGYLSTFSGSGWLIESMVILDYEAPKHNLYYSFGAPICELDGSSEMVRDKTQHQLMVGQIRNHFGWA